MVSRSHSEETGGVLTASQFSSRLSVMVTVIPVCVCVCVCDYK